MPPKRKMMEKVPSASKDILRAETADLLGIMEDDEEDNELEEPQKDDAENQEGSDNPYGFYLDEKPDYDDPYYYDPNHSLTEKIAFYKGVKQQQQAAEKRKAAGEGEEKGDSDSSSSSEDSEADSGEHDEEENEDSEDESSSEDDSESEDSSDEENEQESSNEDEEDASDNEKATNDNDSSKSNINGTGSKSKRKSDKTRTSDTNGNEQKDEYADGDSSDEEEVRNTIGDIPVEWYDEHDHIGYDLAGEKILKPDRGDSLDAFLKRIEDPNYMRTVVDRLTGQDVQLVDGDLELVHRLVKGQVPSAQYNLYEPFLDLYSHQVMETPLSGRPEHKRSFLPSRSERKKVSKMVHALKQGHIHLNKREKRYQVYDLWKSDTVPVPMKRRLKREYKAPPARLPNNNNSYNPPPEFLPTSRQLHWIEHNKNERQKKLLLAMLPAKYNSVRQIPTHYTYVMDVFNRCLDLYMSSRFAYRKVQGHSKDLLPDLPRPRDLRPYPTRECELFEGHKSVVRAVAVHPLGKVLATGSDDHTIKIWEVSSCRCLLTLDVGDAVQCLAWNPNNRVLVLAAAVGKCAIMINPETYLTDKTIVTRTNALFEQVPNDGDFVVADKVKKAVTWLTPSADEKAQGYRVVLKHSHNVMQVVWHQQGDYFATLQPDANTSAVVTHQLSRRRSQLPFSRQAVKVTAIAFHPKKAYFYVCSQGRIRVYSLLERKIIRLIKTNASSDWISSIAVHPTGDHFIVGSYGKRITWYEMECTSRPYTLRYHHGAVRSVAFHRKYPLFASASDDGRVIVTHSMVYKDLIKDPLLVPVKELRNHQMMDQLCVLQVVWHPQLPCLFTAGADGTVRMWQ